MKDIVSKIWKNKWIIRSILSSIYFNFHYLPLKQAIRLPILLYKPNLLDLKGKIIIDSSKVSFGMITLGRYLVPLYPNSGITFQNKGGTIIFKGYCTIGNASTIAVLKNGNLEIGNGFFSSTTLKIVTSQSIKMDNDVRFGWNCTVCDTDFHSLTLVESGKKLPADSPIIIHKNCWFAQNCIILKGTEVPAYCIAATNSLLNKKYDIPTYSLIAGQPAVLKKTGVFRNLNDD